MPRNTEHAFPPVRFQKYLAHIQALCDILDYIQRHAERLSESIPAELGIDPSDAIFHAKEQLMTWVSDMAIDPSVNDELYDKAVENNPIWKYVLPDLKHVHAIVRGAAIED